MYITQIEVSGVRTETHRKETLGNVALFSEGRQVQVMCSVPSEQTEGPRRQRSALVVEAIRQIMRMPEYRGGTSKIDIAPEAWPHGDLSVA